MVEKIRVEGRRKIGNKTGTTDIYLPVPVPPPSCFSVK